jgi:hypothetical protein
MNTNFHIRHKHNRIQQVVRTEIQVDHIVLNLIGKEGGSFGELRGAGMVPGYTLTMQRDNQDNNNYTVPAPIHPHNKKTLL